MIKVFQISPELNVGSVGRIAEQIGERIIKKGWESYIAYGRESAESKSKNLRIGNQLDVYRHVIYSRLTGRHGLGSKSSTHSLIKQIERYDPQLIHLHHLHGYYINFEILFNYLKEQDIPIVWTFHDCWSYTGHCTYYEFVNCQKWQTFCHTCPQIAEYPKSYFDKSEKNFLLKRQLFNSLANLTIVPVSNWLGNETRKSFLKNNTIEVIQNGIDLAVFNVRWDGDLLRAQLNLAGKFIILGVASPWNARKGLKYFLQLSKKISADIQIVLIGLRKDQIKQLPKEIIGLEKTTNATELAVYYNMADVFVNPTLEDTFPTTNLEALGCGTPVVTFRSGGSPEAIDKLTGFVVEKEDVEGLLNAVETIKTKGKRFYSKHCRERAERFFDKNICFDKYINLYNRLLFSKYD